MITVKSEAWKPKNYDSSRLNVVPPPIQLKRATWSKNAHDGTVASCKLQYRLSNADSLQHELRQNKAH
jgi:hypothetical protein